MLQLRDVAVHLELVTVWSVPLSLITPRLPRAVHPLKVSNLQRTIRIFFIFLLDVIISTKKKAPSLFGVFFAHTNEDRVR
jgi:hypothetical protein